MSKKAKFRFYEELNDFLPKEKKKIEFDYSFTGNPAIKDAVEAIGVPHTEVDVYSGPINLARKMRKIRVYFSSKN